LLDTLHNEASERLKTAYAPKSQGPLGSALSALARFAAACPERELFIKPEYYGDISASSHNEWTFILVVWWLTSRPSPTTGRPVTVETAATYVSLLKGYLSFSYGFALVDQPLRLKKLYEDLAQSKPRGGVRKKRRALRRKHLRRIFRLEEAQRTDVDTVNEVAAIGTAWHVLARGGEIAPGVRHAKWNAEAMPTRADLSFHRRKRDGRYAVLWLRPLKKKGKGLAPKVPQYILEHDGSGSDVYNLLQRLERFDPVPVAQRAATPLFRRRAKVRGGRVEARHLTVSQLRKAVKKYAMALGYDDPSVWGAHSPRIGGATDLASTGEASELLLKAKGRWSSEIGAIYARLTRGALLASSSLMQRARGSDLEELMPDFVQPA
jgi:hypothetical protein